MKPSFISFETDRLPIFNWNQYNKTLSCAVAKITSNNVMVSLPTSWQNLDSAEKVQHWIKQREQEAQCYCIINPSLDKFIGILLLNMEQPSKEIRLGYLLAEEFWGQKYASEVIEGLCNYCNKYFSGFKLTAGVDNTNTASIKVLVKNGFKQQDANNNDTLFFEFICN